MSTVAVLRIHGVSPVTVNGRLLLEMTRGRHLMTNPGSAAVPFAPDEIGAAIEGRDTANKLRRAVVTAKEATSTDVIICEARENSDRALHKRRGIGLSDFVPLVMPVPGVSLPHVAVFTTTEA